MVACLFPLAGIGRRTRRNFYSSEFICGQYRGAPRHIPTIGEENTSPSAEREPGPERPQNSTTNSCHPAMGLEGVRAGGPLQLETLSPRAESARPASSFKGIDKTAAAAERYKQGPLRGKGVNLFRGEPLRGHRIGMIGTNGRNSREEYFFAPPPLHVFVSQ